MIGEGSGATTLRSSAFQIRPNIGTWIWKVQSWCELKHYSTLLKEPDNEAKERKD